MANVIAGLFESTAQAERAYHQLREHDLGDNVSIVMKDSSGKVTTDSDSDVLEEAAEGAGIGAIAGAIGGVVLAALPGAPLLVAGPVALAWGLSGAALGSLTGGVAGALIEMGFSESQAARYEESIMAGNALVLVEVDDDDNEEVDVVDLMTSNSADSVFQTM